MKGLIIRDYLVLYKRYLHTPLLVIPLINLLLGMFAGFPLCSLFNLILAPGIAALAMNIFTEDDKDNWLKQVKTMPLKETTIVGSRWIVFAGIILCCFSCSLCIDLASFLFHQDQPFLFYAIFAFAGFFFAFFNTAFSLPACYKFGIKGASNVAVVVLIFISFAGFSIQKIDLTYLISMYQKIPNYLVFAVLIMFFVACFIGSFTLCVFFVKKKEYF